MYKKKLFCEHYLSIKYRKLFYILFIHLKPVTKSQGLSHTKFLTNLFMSNINRLFRINYLVVFFNCNILNFNVFSHCLNKFPAE